MRLTDYHESPEFSDLGVQDDGCPRMSVPGQVALASTSVSNQETRLKQGGPEQGHGSILYLVLGLVHRAIPLLGAPVHHTPGTPPLPASSTWDTGTPRRPD